MLLRPPFMMAIVTIFGMLCGYMLMSGLREENSWSVTVALPAIGCLLHFVHLYHKLLTAPPDDELMENW